MKSLPKNIPRARHKTRGAALITAMLVTLVLSGLGLIALHAVNDTAWKTGNYRARQQASQVSDAVAGLAVYRLGQSGSSYVQSMEDALQKEMKKGGQVTEQKKSALLRRGAYRVFARTPTAPSELSVSYLFTGIDQTPGSQAPPSAGGLFDDAIKGDNPSFADDSSNLDVNYRFIIRDPLDGPPAVGFDRSHCFKKVTVASHGHVSQRNNPDASIASRSTSSTNRNIVETMVGPVPCGEK